jgi:hypothetical protein
MGSKLEFEVIACFEVRKRLSKVGNAWRNLKLSWLGVGLGVYNLHVAILAWSCLVYPLTI